MAPGICRALAGTSIGTAGVVTPKFTQVLLLTFRSLMVAAKEGTVISAPATNRVAPFTVWSAPGVVRVKPRMVWLVGSTCTRVGPRTTSVGGTTIMMDGVVTVRPLIVPKTNTQVLPPAPTWAYAAGDSAAANRVSSINPIKVLERELIKKSPFS